MANTLGDASVYLAPTKSKIEISSEVDGKIWTLIGYAADIQIDNDCDYEDVVSEWDPRPHRFLTRQSTTITARLTPSKMGDMYKIMVGEKPVPVETVDLGAIFGGRR